MKGLRAEGLIKHYRGRAVANGVTLHIAPGEVVGLLGPNGAGKTTSFYMLVGLVHADAGSVWLDDQEITALPMHARARRGIGYLAQEPSVFRGMSVEDNLLAILETRKGLSHSERAARCDQLLHEFGLRQLAKQQALSLSGGERRRLEIARALAVNPRFMLLDEPFAGVDPISVKDIQEIISQLAESGIGILITDHSVRETLGICGHAYIINEGQVLAEGTPEEVLANQRVRDVYLGQDFRL